MKGYPNGIPHHSTKLAPSLKRPDIVKPWLVHDIFDARGLQSSSSSSGGLTIMYSVLIVILEIYCSFNADAEFHLHLCLVENSSFGKFSKHRKIWNTANTGHHLDTTTGKTTGGCKAVLFFALKEIGFEKCSVSV